MKQTKHTIGGIIVLLIAIFLFVQCKNQANETEKTGMTSEINSEVLPLAYVTVDSLIAHFEFYNQLVSKFEDKMVKHNNSLSAGYRKLENEVINFQQKAQTNAFLSQERALQEQNRIQRMKDDLEKQAAQMDKEMSLEQQLLQKQFTDSVVLGIKEFNTPQKYQMIFANSGNSILYADARYDITKEFIEFLNKRFKVK